MNDPLTPSNSPVPPTTVPRPSARGPVVVVKVHGWSQVLRSSSRHDDPSGEL
jgi:hypothetical protein